MEWISVKDRLPEDEQRVIAYCQKVKKYFVGFAERSHYSDKVHWWHEGAKGGLYSATSKVTHWMPLPEPPKER